MANSFAFFYENNLSISRISEWTFEDMNSHTFLLIMQVDSGAFSVSRTFFVILKMHSNAFPKSHTFLYNFENAPESALPYYFRVFRMIDRFFNSGKSRFNSIV